MRFVVFPSSSLPFTALRASLFAAMGLTASGGGCGGNVVVDGTGGGSSASSSSGSSSSSGGTGNECAGAVPVPTTNGAASGFARCPDGTIHRNEPVTCSTTEGIAACTGSEASVTCMSDADCTSSPNGHCASYTQSSFGGPMTLCGCVYPCAADAECGTGEVCVCAGVVPAQNTWATCQPASCTQRSACPSGECGISSYDNGCGPDVEIGCRASTDACRLDAQCMTDQHCAIASGAPWACVGINCAIGRPLFVGAELRTASAIDRGDWMASDLAISLDGLDPSTRAALATHWLEVAAFEHASVASFARFTLDLLAIGAPPGLVADTQRAAMDEVEHARVAYALASAYGGRPVGPGLLDVAGVSLAADLRAVVRALVTEGCVGETLGAAEALALAERVEDPALRAVHARIGADEQRHAELAWRTLAWLVATNADLVDLAEACFVEAIDGASIDPAPRAPFDPALGAASAPSHGVLAPSDIGALRRQALRDVVRPCASELCGAARRAELREPESTHAVTS
jgi:hypothetical protein